MSTSDVDALLHAAEQAVGAPRPSAEPAAPTGETASDAAPPPTDTTPEPAAEDSHPPAAAAAAETVQRADSPDRLQRILGLSVPVIVRLAARSIPVADILQWGRGTIIEFGKPVGSRLELLINDCCIGDGEAVKVDEKFGLRIQSIGSAAVRANSLRSLRSV